MPGHKGAFPEPRLGWRAAPGLRLTLRQIAEEENVERRQELVAAVQAGSVVAWQHINLHGEYDFPDEKLEDSVGLLHASLSPRFRPVAFNCLDPSPVSPEISWLFVDPIRWPRLESIPMAGWSSRNHKEISASQFVRRLQAGGVPMKPTYMLLVLVGAGGCSEVPDQSPVAEAQEDTLQREKDKLQGTWVLDSIEHEDMPPDVGFTPIGITWVIAGDKITMRAGKEENKGTYNIDLTKRPKEIEVTQAAGTEKEQLVPRAVYELEGDQLKLFFGADTETIEDGETVQMEGKSPTELDSKLVIFVFTRRSETQPGKQRHQREQTTSDTVDPKTPDIGQYVSDDFTLFAVVVHPNRILSNDLFCWLPMERLFQEFRRESEFDPQEIRQAVFLGSLSDEHGMIFRFRKPVDRHRVLDARYRDRQQELESYEKQFADAGIDTNAELDSEEMPGLVRGHHAGTVYYEGTLGGWVHFTEDCCTVVECTGDPELMEHMLDTHGQSALARQLVSLNTDYDFAFVAPTTSIKDLSRTALKVDQFPKSEVLSQNAVCLAVTVDLEGDLLAIIEIKANDEKSARELMEVLPEPVEAAVRQFLSASWNRTLFDVVEKQFGARAARNIVGICRDAMEEALKTFAVSLSGDTVLFTVERPDTFDELPNRLKAVVQRTPLSRTASEDPAAGAVERLGGRWKGQPIVEVVVDETAATDADIAHFKTLTTLQRLDLGCTQITDAGLAHLKALSNLQKLGLYDTQITGAGLAHLKGLVSLQWLNLARTQITDGGLVHLQGLKSLSHLDLNDTEITDNGLVHLKALDNLESLALDGTRISDDGVEHLKALTKLGRLGVGRTELTRAGLRDLENALSGCDISH